MALRSGYGPARMAPERYAPFSSNSGAPPGGGGGTAPMPIRAAIPPQSAPARNSLPVRKTEKQKSKKKRPATAPELDELEVETGGGGPPSAPSAGAARIRVGKRGLPDDATAGPGYQRPRFPGSSNRLPAESFAGFRGPSMSAGSLGHLGVNRGKRAPPVLGVRSSYRPFAGPAQRLDNDSGGGGLRERAVQRMRELGHAHTQAQGRSEMIDRQNDLQRAVRRGGGIGDVVPLGKRKRSPGAFSRQAQPRVGGRPAGPQRFSLM